MANARSRSAPSTWRCGTRWRRSPANRCSACSPNVTAAQANPRVFVYAAGGYYYPGKDLSALRGEMRGYLDRGYNVVKMKIGGAPIAEDRERIEAVLKEIGNGRAARGRRQRPLRSGDRDRLRQDAARLSAVLVRGGRRSPRLRAAGGARRILSGADGDRRKPVQPPGCAAT